MHTFSGTLAGVPGWDPLKRLSSDRAVCRRTPASLHAMRPAYEKFFSGAFLYGGMQTYSQASRIASTRKPSCLISNNQSSPSNGARLRLTI